MTTLFAFVVTLGILITVHEYGHYKVARLCGVKVLKFSVGFGRSLWRRQRTPDDTEFAVAAIPLGGYVRMLDEREAPVPAHQLSMAYNRQSLAKRTAIVLAGPLANLMLAVLLYAGAHWIGVREPAAVLSAPVAGSLAETADLRSGDRIDGVSADRATWRDIQGSSELRWSVTRAALEGQPLHLRLSRAGGGTRETTLELDRLPTREIDAAALRLIGLGAPYSAARLGPLKPEGAGAAAGLAQGDLVLSVDGAAVVDAEDLRRRIRALPDRDSRWRVERAGTVSELAVRPRAHRDGTETVGRIDAQVGGSVEYVDVRRGLVEGFVLGAQRTWEISTLTLRMIGRMVIGEASIKNLSGPLTIADVAGQSAQRGLTPFIEFLALVSVSLGVLNLLPLPMLDGGHLMYHLFEAVTGRPVSDAWLERLQRGGIVVLLLLTTIALSNDVVRFFGL